MRFNKYVCNRGTGYIHGEQAGSSAFGRADDICQFPPGSLGRSIGSGSRSGPVFCRAQSHLGHAYRRSRRSEQLGRWQSDFETHAGTAVEEILRWSTPVVHFRRTATTDTEVAGTAIAAGDKVLIFFNSANRDETVFDDPNDFDIGRAPNPHLTLGGGGPHFCLGAHLARLEIRILFEELFRRLPDISISGAPTYMHSMFFNGVKALPCQFTPGARQER